MTQGVPQQRLGDLFTFKNGRAFKKEEWSASGLPIIRIQNLNSPVAAYNFFDGNYSNDILVKKGDLLFSWSGTIGSSFGPHVWDREPGLLNQHIFKVGHKSEIEKRYALHALRFITAEIEKNVSGAVGLVHITKERLNELLIPVPPIAEQRRIVVLLDEAFAGIATAKANAEKSLRNADELFGDLRLAAFDTPGWDEKPFEDCIEDVTYTNKIQRKNFLDEGEYPVISQEEAFINGYWNGAADVFRVDRPLLLFGDHTKALKYVDFDFVLGADGVKILKPKLFLHPRFFYHQLRTAKLDSLGYARHYKLLKELVIRYPSQSEQQRIATELDSADEQAEHLESIYTRKLAALDELKQSLLQRAFSGQL